MQPTQQKICTATTQNVILTAEHGIEQKNHPSKSITCGSFLNLKT